MMSSCLKCGLPFVGEVRSRRLGADEPGVIVVCRCDKLGETHGYVTRLVDEVASLAIAVGADDGEPCTEEPSNTGYFGRISGQSGCSVEYEVSLDARLSKCCYERVGCEDVHWFVEEGCAASLCEDGLQVACKARLRCDCEGRVSESVLKVSDTATVVAPGMTFRRSREIEVDAEAVKRTLLFSMQTYRVPFVERRVRLGKWLCRARHYTLEDRYAAEFEYMSSDPICDEEEVGILAVIHSRFCHVEGYADVLGEQTLSRLRSVASPVKDVRTPPSRGVSYRVKVDGEHGWLIEAGTIWYICRNDPKLSVVGFRVKSVLDPLSPMSMVLRVEQMPDGSFILIDLLAMGGTLEQTTRPYDSWRKMLLHRYLPDDLLIRDEFECIEDARGARASAAYGSDGVIVIDKSTSHTYRVKEPTMDLLCKGGGLYVAVGGKASKRVGVSSARMREGAVYECVLGTPVASSVPIASYICRTDKVLPNPAHVYTCVSSILQSTDDYDVALIDRVSAYSFSVRAAMYQRVSNRGYMRTLVVDVGSGRLQAQGVMSSEAQCSYLLCDPRLNVRRARQQVNSVDATDFDAVAMVELVRAMSRSRQSYACYRGRFERLVALPGVVHALKRCGATIVYSFSLSYVSGVFNHLATLGLRQIGCCYVYDAVDEQGVLVNVGGVHLRLCRDNAKQAIATFGQKVSFKEPAVTTASFPHARIFPATSIARLDDEACERLHSVTQHIVIVVSF